MKAGTGTVGFIVNPTTVTSSVSSSIASTGLLGFARFFVPLPFFGRPLVAVGKVLAGSASCVSPVLTPDTWARVVRDLLIAANTSDVEFHESILDQSNGVPMCLSTTCFVSTAMAAAKPPAPISAQRAFVPSFSPSSASWWKWWKSRITPCVFTIRWATSGEHKCTNPVESVLTEFVFEFKALSFSTTSHWSSFLKTSSHVKVIVIGDRASSDLSIASVVRVGSGERPD